ncbi:MAG: hypothetical protein WKF92_09440 [Pyrinomonadaceae bacterium]
MEPVQLNYQEAFFWGIIINTGIGFVLGLIPLIIGIVKRNFKYGIFGHVAATVGGAVLGIFLSVPAVIIFTWLILKNSNSPSNIESNAQPLDSDNN